VKISGDEFLAQDKKAITLIGMSGVGKSYISCALEEWGWTNYSCDYLIGTKYLGELIKSEGEMSAGNIANLSDFVGQLGDEAQGGTDLDEFRRRQRLYYGAERDVLRDMGAALDRAEGHFVCDSSGSLCEVEDEAVLEDVGRKSLMVYLKVRQEGQAEILKRALDYPKPLYFPPAFLDERLARYMAEFDLENVQDIHPVEFLRWIFPHLFESRLPKYERLAKKYGVVLPSHKVDLDSETAFFECIAGALDE
jgi:hypothetical protein